MKRLLTLVTCLISAVTLSFLPPAVHSDQDLKAALQQAMSQTRQAILTEDLTAFRASVDPLNNRSQISDEQWQQLITHSLGKKMLLRGTPDLQQDQHFLTLKTENQWAAYYTETGLDDDHYQTLSVFLFHHSDDQWRPAGKRYGLTKAKPGSEAAKTYAAWSNRQQMLETIETDQTFSIEQLAAQ
ncbi:MAG: hypothetical protein KUG52_04330 [Immundisolibacteraceae bacterium]|nr:hypothetical protein [Immundisolibacteraceae bacterium]